MVIEGRTKQIGEDFRASKSIGYQFTFISTDIIERLHQTPLPPSDVKEGLRLPISLPGELISLHNFY